MAPHRNPGAVGALGESGAEQLHQRIGVVGDLYLKTWTDSGGRHSKSDPTHID